MPSPLFLIIAFAVLAGPLLVYRWRIRKVSGKWSVAEAKLDSGNISSARMGSRYVLRVRYSYLVSKQIYGGTYYRYFRTQAEADHLWNSLHQLMPLVRYDPHNPSRSYFDPYRDAPVGELGHG